MNANNQTLFSYLFVPRVMCISLIISVLIFCLLGWFLTASIGHKPPELEPLVTHTLIGAGLITTLLSFLVRSRMLGREKSENAVSPLNSYVSPSSDSEAKSKPKIDNLVLQKFFRAHVVSMILCENTGASGLILCILTGNLVIQLAMSALAIYGFLAQFPRASVLLGLQKAHELRTDI